MKRKKETKRADKVYVMNPAGLGLFEDPRFSLAAVLLLGSIFFNRALLSGSMLFGTDYVTGAHMSREFARYVVVKLHQVPLWYPAVFGGIPYVDAVAGDLFYPSSAILRFIMPAHQMTAWNYFLHLILAGTGAYFFLRSLRLSGAASFLAGVAYMFTGSVASLMYAGHDAKIIVSALLPWLLLSIDRASRTRKLVWGLIGGIVIGMALLSPHVQMSYYLLLAGFLYGLARMYVLWRDGRQKGNILRLAGLGVAMLAVGFGLYAIQALPLQYYMKFSPRGQDKGYAFATSYSMPPEEVVDTVWPEFSGLLDKNADSPTHLYWGRRDLKLHTEYVGVIPMLLAVIGIIYGRRRRLKIFLCALAGFALIVAFGGFTPLYYLVYYLVPGMSKFRSPAMIFNIAAFAAAGLAALGAEALLSGGERPRLKRGLLIALGAGLLFGLVFTAAREAMVSLLSPFAAKGWGSQALWNSHPEMVKGYWTAFVLLLAGSLLVWLLAERRIKPAAWAAATAVLVFLELWRVDARFMKRVEPPEVFFAKDQVVESLQRDDSLFRVWPLQVHQQGNYLTLFGLQTVGGEHPNPMRRYNEFVGTDPKRLLPDFHNLLQSPQLLNVLNVKYLLMQQAVDFPQFAIHDSCYGGRVKIYRNTGALPRAWLAGQYEVIKGDQAILERLRSPDIDLSSTVVLEEEPEGFAPSGRPRGSAKVDSYQPNVVELNVESDRPSLLVVADNWYPAWRATVDGKPAPVYRADYTFRALPVPAGNHRVEFRFRSAIFQAGLAVSLATAILTALGIAACILYEKRKP